MSLITPDAGLLFWMVLIFGILFLILWRFGFPVITSAVEKRDAGIADSLRKADQARLRLEELDKEQAALIAKTRAEQTAILKEAARTKEQIIAQARIDAGAQAEKLLEKARAEIAAEKESALRDIRREIALLSVGVAEKIVRRELSSDVSKEYYLSALVDEFTSSRAGKQEVS